MKAHFLPAVPMRIAIDFALFPLKALIAELLEKSTYDIANIDGKEMAVFSRAGQLYPLVFAIEGLIDWFDKAVGDITLTDPLRLLVLALQDHIEISESMLLELQALMPKLKAAGRQVSRDVARRIVEQQQILAAQEAA